MTFNGYGVWAIYRFEMARALRTLWQSVVTPVITTALYFVVFGSAIGGRMEAVDGDFEVSKRDGGGTALRFTVPLGKARLTEEGDLPEE